MARKKRLTAAAIGIGIAAALATAQLSGQDPDGGAGRGRPLAAYRPAVPGVHGLVSAGHPLAAIAGLQVLMKGGNAIDAAVAVGAVLNMMEPQMNGIGGNGFMTIFDKKSGKVHSLSMAGATPKALKAEAMTPQSLGSGIDAGIVPGNFGGYLVALERFGTMKLADVLASGIDYAQNGYPIDASLATAISRSKANLSKYPTTAKVFLPGGRAPEAGELWKNPDLAATLKKAVEAEAQALKQGKSRVDAIEAAFDRFYKGDIAQEFDRFFKENKGAMTAADLAAYRPQWQEPVHVTYRGYDVYSNPSTSRGGIELAMQLNLVEGFDLAKMGAGSPEALHLLIEAIKVAKADVYHYVADPKFAQVPLAGLLSKAYADERRKLIDPHKAMNYPAHGEPPRSSPSAAGLDALRLARPEPVEGRARSGQASAGPVFTENYEREYDTTSFSIVDQFGNAVGTTPTLGGGFGNGVVVGNTGMLLNNGIRLGSTSPYPDHINYVRGGQIPLLNNAPSIVLKDGKLAMVFGTPGGETIGQTEFQMLVNVVDFKMPVQQAVEAPRFALDAEPNFYKAGSPIAVNIERRVPAAALKTLTDWGHKLQPSGDFTAGVGGMQAIVIDLNKGTMMAGADPRRTGYAIGW
jgi:gamma-glutamyltranspeptidase / glutathione hydrolase